MKVKKLQTGGQVSPEQAQPQAQQGGPEEQLAQMAMQIVSQLGPEMAAALAQMIVQMLQEAAPAPQGEPVYARKGGKLVLMGRR